MGLTATKTVLLAVLVAVLLFAATIWLWPKLAGRSVQAVLGRIGTLLLAQISLFAAVGLWANQSFGFYGSWADLLGTEDTPGVVVDHDTPLSKQVQVQGVQKVNVPGSHQATVAGRIEKVTIQGPQSRIASKAYVYLPPEYFQEEYKNHRFRAALVLTGYPGTTEALMYGLKYPQTAHKLVKDGKMPPMVLVMMRPTVKPPRDTECMDVPGGPQTETYFTQDVRNAVTAHYRVGDKAQNWGVMGNSTGGYCALKMPMRHPKAFSVGVGLSPAYEAPKDATTGDLFGGSAQVRRENNLMWRLDHKPAPPVSLLVTSSKHGEKLHKKTEKFIDKVIKLNRQGAPTRISSMILESGGHNFNTWKREIPGCLEWLSNRLEAPEAPKPPAHKAPKPPAQRS
ncbi:esterase family protein [Streptomyces sp. XD-27]|uniref:alpha/beta hydrolase n=1 Tax=Streptomyces sp. XD-27 TaxID=3062779 RepID=UPI0026F478AA|nr:alpha/beta hydrolase-fold protein [Streptomyces sp. XD-27]WKX71790.1 alpha/beta hydrolase-fold protein [Streptomyces sp. XD-27]